MILVGAKPIIAFGSALIISARLAKLAKVCPVQGLARTEMKGMPFLCNKRAEAEVLAICRSDSIPSWILLPPLVTTAITGIFFLAPCSKASAIRSPATELMVPPIKLKSNTTRIAWNPCILHWPVIAASVKPVRS